MAARASADDPTEAILAAWRAESARLVGALTRMTGDVELAEDLAQANVAASEVADRVTVSCADVAGHGLGELDAAFAFECVHDMSAPVEVLAQVRRALRPGAPLIVMDEAVGDEFTAPGGDVERLMYGFSLGVCLPDGMSRSPSAGTGTVMRPATLRAYALQAGFTDMSVLPIEDFGFWRFYRLT